MKIFIPLELRRVEAAERLGVGQRTFDRHVATGLIKPVRYVGKFPRFSREQIDKFNTLDGRCPGTVRRHVASEDTGMGGKQNKKGGHHGNKS